MTQINLFDLPEEVDVENIDRPMMPDPGRGHFLVSGVEETPDYIKVITTILAHEVEANVGRTFFNNFFLTGFGLTKTLNFALACGLLTKERLIEAKANNETLNIDYDSAYGCTFCGSLVHSKDKKYINFGRDFYNPGWEAAAKYPKDVNTPGKNCKEIPQEKAEVKNTPF